MPAENCWLTIYFSAFHKIFHAATSS